MTSLDRFLALGLSVIPIDDFKPNANISSEMSVFLKHSKWISFVDYLSSLFNT